MTSLSAHLLDSHSGTYRSQPQQDNSFVQCSNGAAYNPSVHGRAPFAATSTPFTANMSSYGANTSFGSANSSFFAGDVSEESARQIATLQAKLDKKLGPEYVSSRAGAGGMKLTYVEGWKAINLANEVFGFNGWASSISRLEVDFCDYNEQTQRYNVGVTAVVRVTLRDGAYHEDVGYGVLENSKQKGAALDKCKKEAVTDGIKRALRNFGNLLGNCLYDKSYISEVVKMKIPPPKFDRSSLHRRPEYEESPIPNNAHAGPSNPNSPSPIPNPVLIPSEIKPLSSVPPRVRPSSNAVPHKPSPLSASTISTTNPSARGSAASGLGNPERPATYARYRQPAGPQADKIPATDVTSKENVPPPSTPNYFGSDDDDAAYLDVDLGVEECTTEEAYGYVDDVDLGGDQPMEVMESHELRGVSPPSKPSSSAESREKLKELVRRAIAEQQEEVPKGDASLITKSDTAAEKEAPVRRISPQPPKGGPPATSLGQGEASGSGAGLIGGSAGHAARQSVGGFHWNTTDPNTTPTALRRPNAFGNGRIKRPADGNSVGVGTDDRDGMKRIRR